MKASHIHPRKWRSYLWQQAGGLLFRVKGSYGYLQTTTLARQRLETVLLHSVARAAELPSLRSRSGEYPAVLHFYLSYIKIFFFFQMEGRESGALYSYLQS